MENEAWAYHIYGFEFECLGRNHNLGTHKEQFLFGRRPHHRRVSAVCNESDIWNLERKGSGTYNPLQQTSG
jgi:hypothetical protein